MALVLGCGLPPLLTGLAEDLTKQVGVRTRLFATATGGALAIFLVGVQISSVNLPGFDWLKGFTVLSLFFKVLAMAGVANAVNVIDGDNGLASVAVAVAISLLSLAYVGWQVMAKTWPCASRSSSVFSSRSHVSATLPGFSSMRSVSVSSK